LYSIILAYHHASGLLSMLVLLPTPTTTTTTSLMTVTCLARLDKNIYMLIVLNGLDLRLI
jgi:hypothetical protein